MIEVYSVDDIVPNLDGERSRKCLSDGRHRQLSLTGETFYCIAYRHPRVETATRGSKILIEALIRDYSEGEGQGDRIHVLV